MNLPSVLDLLKAGVHFGHQKSRWHPKMKDQIFTERGGVHIIDLDKTLEKLEIATDFAREVAQNGGVVLFVGTKKQGQEIIKKDAISCGMPFINEKWIGGMFTNFPNVGKLIRKYRDLKEKKEAGALLKYTKKEQVEFDKEIDKLQRFVGGLVELKKIPEAIFVLDVKKEKTAVSEARKKGVKIIGFCDTNINPDLLDYPIFANDDAVKSIELITGLMAEAIKEGKSKTEVAKA
ncbi:MAG: 30S ribosomal protein S2 [Patescibacteria group bacterium]